MYQLGISAATAEAPCTRMSITLGANRWASRVVVVLQLAAWSAVGMVLLQKGVSSLQKTAEARNATKVNFTEAAAVDAEVRRIFGEDDQVAVHSSALRFASSNGREEGESDDLDEPSPLEKNPHETGFLSDAEWKEVLGISPDLKKRHSASKGQEDAANTVLPLSRSESTLTSNHLSGGSKFDKSKVPSPRIENGAVRKSGKNSSPDFPESLLSPEDEPMDQDGEYGDSTTTLGTDQMSPFGKYDNTLEAKNKMKMSNLSGGGAAAAVAMVAVGAVMLVLGPAVIVLRALDERRQERRFLKLSGQDDLPPSYEQATLMDEAPRYSTLSLNTISGTSQQVGTSVACAVTTTVPINDSVNRIEEV